MSSVVLSVVSFCKGNSNKNYWEAVEDLQSRKLFSRKEI